MTSKIQKYEDAIRRELKRGKEITQLYLEEQKLYARYNQECAERINRFLESIGSKKRFVPTQSSCFEYFVVDNFSDEDEESEKVVEFCKKNIPRFKSGIKIPKNLCLSGFKAFQELNIPLNLQRTNFSSEEMFKEYMSHVHSVMHDCD